MKSRHKKVAVALSGGVDSSVAAALLQDRGYGVIGLWMQFLGEGPPEINPSFREARRSAETLGIPLYAVDLRCVFQEEIVDYFLREYMAGRTPNPCALCNPKIKFGYLLQRALGLGAEGFATGHYARLQWDPHLRGFTILKGVDRQKDQSYFLWGLSQAQLAHCILPNGGLTKKEVREIARQRGLSLTERRESQEICFIPEGDYRDFLRRQLKGKLPPGGKIVDRDGCSLGRHRGIFSFTIGQRRGIGIPARRPYYVLEIDPINNRVVVGGKDDLLRRGLVAQGMNWASTSPPTERFRAKGKVRYRYPEGSCTVIPSGEGEVTVHFDELQECITPGQALVLYQDEVLLGGGWIRDVCGE